MLFRFWVMELSLLQMKQKTRWSILWGDSSRLYLQIFSRQYFPTCNRSNSSSYSPFYRHRFFAAARSGLFFLIFHHCYCQPILCVEYFSGWGNLWMHCSLGGIWSCHRTWFCCRVCILSCTQNMFLRLLQQRCKANGEICCRLGWTYAA